MIQQPTALTNKFELEGNLPELQPGEASPPAYTPGTRPFYDLVKRGLAQAESSGNQYAEAPNSSAHGKYQFLDATREGVMPGIGRDQFLTRLDLQEEAMDRLLQQNLDYASNKGVKVNEMSPADAAGMLWAMHLKGANEGLKTATNVNFAGKGDPNGTTPRAYYNKGRMEFMKAAGISIEDNSLDSTEQASLFNAKGNRVIAARLTSPEQPVVWSEYYNKVVDGAMQQTTMGQAKTTYGVLGEALERINKTAGTQYALADVVPHMKKGALGSIFGENYMAFAFGPQLADTQTKFNRLLETIRANQPGIKLPYKSFEDLKPSILEQMKVKETEAAQANAESGWIQRIMGFGAEAATYMASGLPEAMSTLLGGVAGGGVQTAAIIPGAVVRGALQGASIAPVQGEVQATASELGDKEAGLARGAANVGIVAAGSAVLDAGISMLKQLLHIRAPLKAPNQGKIHTEEGAKELAKAADEAGVNSPDLDHIATVHSQNPAGQGLEGAADLDTRLTKAATDLAHDQPISVVPDAAPVPKLEIQMTQTESTFNKMLSELDGNLAKQYKADLPQLRLYQEQASTVSTEQFRNTVKSPTTPVVAPMQQMLKKMESDLQVERTAYELPKEFDKYNQILSQQVADNPDRMMLTINRDGMEIEMSVGQFQGEVKAQASFLKELSSCITGGLV